MTTTAAHAAFYLRRTVHLAVVIDGTPADHSMCGVALLGAIDTTADATCADCRRVADRLAAAAVEVELTDDEIAEAREELEADDAAGAAMLAETRTARLTMPADQLRRADRIVNLTAGRAVTVFDLTVGEHLVDVFPAQADLDAGAERRYTISAGDLVVVDREVEVDGRPVQPAPQRPDDLDRRARIVAALDRTADAMAAADLDALDTAEVGERVAEVTVRGRRYTARRELVGRDQRIEVGQRAAVVVRNSRGVDVGTVFEPSGNTPRSYAAIVVGCPTSWSGEDSRHAAREILAQLGR